MTNNSLNRCAATAAMLLAAATLQAGLFQGSTEGAFWNPTGPDTMVVDGVGTSFFEWGAPDSSSLLFTGTDFDAVGRTPFAVGTLTYENATSAIGTGATAVDLAVTFTFTVPDIPGTVFTYTLDLVNTVNTDRIEESADLITIPDPLSLPIVIGNVATTLRVWFGDVVGDGHVDPYHPNTFHVHEGGEATVELRGLIRFCTPDGGLTIALLGAALGGIGLINLNVRK